MKTGISLPELISEVQRRTAGKKDVLVDTKDKIRMVPVPAAIFTNGIGIAIDNPAQPFEVLAITEQAHRQIATWVKVPWEYYTRLLKDHPDMVMENVNKLFEREPGIRMVRTLDNKCRAFLSDQYRRLDNDMVLAKTLPAIIGKSGMLPPTAVLANHITDDDMRIKVVFTDDALAQDIGPSPRPSPRTNNRDICRPGFEVGNSETGKGSLFVRGFFFRDYCNNGCVWGTEDMLSYERRHLGGKLKTANGISVLSQETLRRDDEAIVSALHDVMRALGSAETVQRLGDALRAAKADVKLERPQIGVQVLGQEVGLRENELDLVLANLIEDGDLSRYGVLNAVTAVANRDETPLDRSLQLEEIGSTILNFPVAKWLKIATAEKVPVRRAA